MTTTTDPRPDGERRSAGRTPPRALAAGFAVVLFAALLAAAALLQRDASERAGEAAAAVTTGVAAALAHQAAATVAETEAVLATLVAAEQPDLTTPLAVRHTLRALAVTDAAGVVVQASDPGLLGVSNGAAVGMP